MDNGVGFPQHSRNLGAVLEQVRNDFVLRLRKQMDQLKAARNGLYSHGREGELKVIEFAAHQICGIAKTVGFADLGIAAEQLEAAISSGNGEPESHEVRTIASLVEIMLQEMAAVSAQSGS